MRLPTLVSTSEQVKQLTTDRSVTSERNGSELKCQLFSTSVYCELVEMGLERSISIPIDPNVSMPFHWTTSCAGDATLPVGNGVPVKPERNSAKVLELLSLTTLAGVRSESMVSFGEKEYEPMPKAEVLGVGKSLLAASCSLPFRDIDAVLADQLAIDRRGRFTFGYMAGDVPIVAVSQVAGRD